MIARSVRVSLKQQRSRLRRSLTLGRKPKRFLVFDGGRDIRAKEGVLGMPTKADRRSAVTYSRVEAGAQPAKPVLHQKGHEIQPYGKIAQMPIALDEMVCAASAENLNQLLADTITLRDLYKKYHWQVAGHTFYQLHLLFDKHYNEQNELVDTIAEPNRSRLRHFRIKLRQHRAAMVARNCNGLRGARTQSVLPGRPFQRCRRRYRPKKTRGS